ncbi:uncharacterized protein LOC121412713 [Lytechinus variegatus]|uniref:uncharacterized protein LOC121412713 n=1 Tax=Lytechinus variegatus TaxID=7654 RepID=UPI001BB21610|nr:uncharacterized protein LOC121412713 [Lytechinus variegatus]
MLVNVMDLLRKKCNIDDEDVLLDLADEEGLLKSLPDYSTRVNTKHLLKPRATYVPIKIERDENDAVKPYEPYVQQLKENAEFMNTLLAQYRKKELPNQGKKEKNASGRNRASTSSSSTPRATTSASKMKSKKGGTTSRAGKASR